MFFKNAIAYRLTESITTDQIQLESSLANLEFHPCARLDAKKYGFVPPISGTTSFLHSANGFIMICAKRQEKIIPAAAVNELVSEKVAAITEAESSKPHRRERSEIKDDVIMSLLPNALTRSSLDYAFIDTKNGLIVCNSPSAKRAENLLSLLREALGSLKCLPIQSSSIPAKTMTGWIREEAPENFSVGDDCVLMATKDERAIRVKKTDLSSDELIVLLDSGMHASSLSMNWENRLTFTLTEDLHAKRLKFDDKILELAYESNPETYAEQFDADFVIMTETLSELFNNILQFMGGEKRTPTEEKNNPPIDHWNVGCIKTPILEIEKDPLLNDALEALKDHQPQSLRAPISTLQRRIRVGYNRACKLVDQLQDAGLIIKSGSGTIEINMD